MSRQTATVLVALMGAIVSIVLGILNRTNPPPAPKQDETLAKEFYALSREAAQRHGSALGTLIPEVIDGAKKVATLEEHGKAQDKTLEEIKTEIKALHDEQIKLVARLGARAGRPTARIVEAPMWLDHDQDGVATEPPPAPAPPPEAPPELKALETWKPQSMPTIEQVTSDPAYLQRAMMAE